MLKQPKEYKLLALWWSNCYWTLLFLAFPLLGAAQIVNIEQKRLQTDSIGWIGRIAGGANLYQNTNSLLSLSLNVHTQYNFGEDLLLLLGDFNLVRSNKEQYLNNRFFHLRYNHKIKSWLRWEYFFQVQNNRVINQNWRILNATGPRFIIRDKPTLRVVAGSQYMYEFEQSISPVETFIQHRSSNYLSASIHFAKNVEFIGTFFYQPRLDFFADYKMAVQSNFQVGINNKLALNLSYNLNYDAYPLPNAPKVIYSFQNGLSYLID